LAALDLVLEHYHTDTMHQVFSTQETWATNWKSLIENFMEGYHLSTVHPQTLAHMTPTRLCEKLDGGRDWTGYRAHYPEHFDAEVDNPDLTPMEQRCSTLFSVFPGQVVSQRANMLVYLALQPLNVNEVCVRWGCQFTIGFCWQDRLISLSMSGRRLIVKITQYSLACKLGFVLEMPSQDRWGEATTRAQ
jgi:phenylpropionate dioxygenase-like ring-hydroxylating dioxygenase large terminal subunit